MFRKFGNNKYGSTFGEEIKLAVWLKGIIVPGVDPSKMRKDTWGAWITWNEYGITTENGTGWEIDHIKPVSKDGTDDLFNLQPLQWQNNRSKGDDYPNWKGSVKATIS